MNNTESENSGIVDSSAFEYFIPNFEGAPVVHRHFHEQDIFSAAMTI
jgi:hypothetical protein